MHSGCAQAVGFQGPVRMFTTLLKTVATTHRSGCGIFPVGPACYAYLQLCDSIHKCDVKCHMSYFISLASNTDEKEIQPQLSLCTCRNSKEQKQNILVKGHTLIGQYLKSLSNFRLVTS